MSRISKVISRPACEGPRNICLTSRPIPPRHFTIVLRAVTCARLKCWGVIGRERALSDAIVRIQTRTDFFVRHRALWDVIVLNNTLSVADRGHNGRKLVSALHRLRREINFHRILGELRTVQLSPGHLSNSTT